jgi:hypothetical protein
MITVVAEPADIARYLTALRAHDRAAIGAAEAAVVTRLLEAHTVVMAHDDAGPVEESLATWLSLLDEPRWRERVRELRVDAAYLAAGERALLTDVLERAGARVPAAAA